jgi:hypothetical protein
MCKVIKSCIASAMLCLTALCISCSSSDNTMSGVDTTPKVKEGLIHVASLSDYTPENHF